MLLRLQKAAVRKKYETGNQAFSMRLRFLTTRGPGTSRGGLATSRVVSAFTSLRLGYTDWFLNFVGRRDHVPE